MDLIEIYEKHPCGHIKEIRILLEFILAQIEILEEKQTR